MSTQVARYAAPAEKLLSSQFVHVKTYMEEKNFATSKPCPGVTASGKTRTTNIWEYIHTALGKQDPEMVYQFILPNIPGKAGIMFHRDFMDEKFPDTWMEEMKKIVNRESAQA